MPESRRKPYNWILLSEDPPHETVALVGREGRMKKGSGIAHGDTVRVVFDPPRKLTDEEEASIQVYSMEGTVFINVYANPSSHPPEKKLTVGLEGPMLDIGERQVSSKGILPFWLYARDKLLRR